MHSCGIIQFESPSWQINIFNKAQIVNELQAVADDHSLKLRHDSLLEFRLVGDVKQIEIDNFNEDVTAVEGLS